MDEICHKVSSGWDHALILDKDGKLYGMGNNDSGQLDPSLADGYIYTPHCIAQNVKSASAGYNYSVYVTNDGDVHILGSGEFAEKFTGFKNARQVYALKNDDVFWIEDDDCRLYAFGNNTSGQICKSESMKIHQYGQESCYYCAGDCSVKCKSRHNYRYRSCYYFCPPRRRKCRCKCVCKRRCGRKNCIICKCTCSCDRCSPCCSHSCHSYHSCYCHSRCKWHPYCCGNCCGHHDDSLYYKREEIKRRLTEGDAFKSLIRQYGLSNLKLELNYIKTDMKPNPDGTVKDIYEPYVVLINNKYFAPVQCDEKCWDDIFEQDYGSTDIMNCADIHCIPNAEKSVRYNADNYAVIGNYDELYIFSKKERTLTKVCCNVCDISVNRSSVLISLYDGSLMYGSADAFFESKSTACLKEVRCNHA